MTKKIFKIYVNMNEKDNYILSSKFLEKLFWLLYKYFLLPFVEIFINLLLKINIILISINLKTPPSNSEFIFVIMLFIILS